MKNNIKIALMFVLVICAFLVIQYEEKTTKKSDLELVVDDQEVSLQFISNQEKINLYHKDDCDYLFLPSYVGEQDRIYYDQDAYEIVINGEQQSKDYFSYELNSPTSFEIRDAQTDSNIYYSGTIITMKSANLYTMYIDLGDKEKDDLTKEAYAEARIRSINPDGTSDFYGEQQHIKVRGNSLAETQKKPFGLKMSEDVSLCGLEAGKKWVLLANAYEGTHMTNKLTLDMAQQFGLAYTSQSDWLDVYVNGEYQGNYLICQKIQIDHNSVNITDLDKSNEKCCEDIDNLEHFEIAEDSKGYLYEKEPSNITGGYLIERDYYYPDSECGFYTKSKQPFTIRGPKHASESEVKYIQGVFQNLEDLIHNKDEKVYEYIDTDSFVRRYLIEELCFNTDSSLTSYNFYKNANEDTIYAGPLWDYDCGYGEADGIGSDYTASIRIDPEDREEEDNYKLLWDSELYEMDSYKEQVIQTYQQYYPYLLEVINTRIDQYAAKIDRSVRMDEILWDYAENSAGHYYEINNNIRYLKYFLVNRLNRFNEEWNLPYEKLIPETTNQLHTVSVYYEDQVIQFQVADGTCLFDEDLPEYDNEKYSGWRYARDHKFLSEWVPVYEDIILYPNERG